MTELFFKGLGLGLLVAAQVGPISLLAIRRVTAYGFGPGFATGLGAASADFMYALAAAFGLAALGALLEHLALPLQAAGGAFLVWLGVRAWIARHRLLRTDAEGEGAGLAHPVIGLDRSIGGAYASSFLLTMTNPMTIVFFAGVFASLGVAGSSGGGSPWPAVLTAIGVGLGSALWMLGLTGVIRLVRDRLTRVWLVRINGVSALLILGFGLISAGRALSALVSAWISPS